MVTYAGPDMDALDAVASWPVGAAAVAVARFDPLGADGAGASRTPKVTGDLGRVFPWASVTKPATALAVLVAVEEGTLDLDGPAGPPGATVRHLLAHASGLGPDPGPPIEAPGVRRIYSNAGYVVLAETLASRRRACRSPATWPGVLEPLGMTGPPWTDPPAGRGGRRTRRTAGRSGGPGRRVGPTDAGRRRDLATPPPPSSSPGSPGCCPGSVRSTRATGGSASRCGAAEAPALDGPANSPAHLRPLRPVRLVPVGGSRWPACCAAGWPTGRSASGRRGRGRPWPRRCWPRRPPAARRAEAGHGSAPPAGPRLGFAP